MCVVTLIMPMRTVFAFLAQQSSALSSSSRYGGNSLQLSKASPLVCKCLADPTSAVRDAAADCLTEMYIHVGDKLVSDIQKRHLIPDSK